MGAFQWKGVERRIQKGRERGVGERGEGERKTERKAIPSCVGACTDLSIPQRQLYI